MLLFSKFALIKNLNRNGHLKQLIYLVQRASKVLT